MNGKQGLRKGAIWTGSHLLELSYILSLLVFPAACIVETFLRTGRPGELQMVLAFFAGLLMIHPLILTVINVFYWIYPGRCPAILDAGNRTEIFVIVEGIAFSFLLLGIVGENWSDWWTPLDSGRSFSPVCSKALPTLAVFTLAAMIGYAVLRLTPADPAVGSCGNRLPGGGIFGMRALPFVADSAGRGHSDDETISDAFSF